MVFCGGLLVDKVGFWLGCRLERGRGLIGLWFRVCETTFGVTAQNTETQSKRERERSRVHMCGKIGSTHWLDHGHGISDSAGRRVQMMMTFFLFSVSEVWRDDCVVFHLSCVSCRCSCVHLSMYILHYKFIVCNISRRFGYKYFISFSFVWWVGFLRGVGVSMFSL